MLSDHKPFLIILSAPSGCGKTTLLKLLLERVDGLGVSISHTTRAPRPGEEDGKDYHFVSESKFLQMQATGQFVESAFVHEHYYGTALSSLNRLFSQGLDVVLDIDVQGMEKIRACASFDFVSIFILPPSMGELESRLRKRQTDSDSDIESRLKNASDEIVKAKFYDYVVVNDILSESVENLSKIIVAERLRSSRHSVTL